LASVFIQCSNKFIATKLMTLKHILLLGRPEGRRPLGRPRRRWEDNIKIDLQEVGWEAWTGLIWLRIGTGGGLL
jgi:hypothetical protein